MFFFPNTTSSGVAVRYLIAQYTPDPFRREPRNVGVVIGKGGYTAARFIGESDEHEGRWDTRRLRSFGNPNAYRLWVDHWRSVLAEANGDWEDRLVASRSDEFAIVSGGEVRDTGADSPHDVCDYLYKRLVSPGGLLEALSTEAEEESVAVLKNEITGALRRQGILADSLLVHHPVYTNWDVMGARHWHTLALYQEMPQQSWAIEPVDFTMINKRLARDHAAYARYVFTDLRAQQQRTINTIAIIRMQPTDADHKDVQKGLEILEPSCSIVDWLDPRQRQAFIDEREAIANAA